MRRPISGYLGFWGELSEKMIITWPMELADTLDFLVKPSTAPSLLFLSAPHPPEARPQPAAIEEDQAIRAVGG